MTGEQRFADYVVKTQHTAAGIVVAGVNMQVDRQVSRMALDGLVLAGQVPSGIRSGLTQLLGLITPLV